MQILIICYFFLIGAQEELPFADRDETDAEVRRDFSWNGK